MERSGLLCDVECSLLNELENDSEFKERINNTRKIENESILIKTYLIKAKLEKDPISKSEFCRKVISTTEENSSGSKSIKTVYPLIQAYICLNKVSEIEKNKSKLIELGITNFDL